MERLLSDPAAAPTLLRFTAPFDFSGSPCLTLTLGFTKDGLPISFQTVGRCFDEGRLLGIGDAYETATEWVQSHPSL